MVFRAHVKLRRLQAHLIEPQLLHLLECHSSLEARWYDLKT
jgi:hypothetical protein